MAEMTIGAARDNFSAIIADITSGAVKEYVVKKRDVPVAKIVPIDITECAGCTFGLFKDEPMLVDDAAFDELDDEIAADFGA